MFVQDERCSSPTTIRWLRLSAGRATQFSPTRKGSERRGWIMRERRRCNTYAMVGTAMPQLHAISRSRPLVMS